MGRILKDFARSLRRNQTDAEQKLWVLLRSKRFKDVKFRRQQPLDPYIVDFCSFEKMLVIELDGGQHAKNQEKDSKRTKFLECEGYRVIRFWDHEVLTNFEGVLEKILQYLR